MSRQFSGRVYAFTPGYLGFPKDEDLPPLYSLTAKLNPILRGGGAKLNPKSKTFPRGTLQTLVLFFSYCGWDLRVISYSDIFEKLRLSPGVSKFPRLNRNIPPPL